MLQITGKGDFSKTDHFLAKLKSGSFYKGLDVQARRGVAALASATPTDSGKAAHSWNYEIEITAKGCTISWTNDDVDITGTPIVVLRQHGHGTGTGGYVTGQDFINPAIRPIFDEIEQAVWKEVTS